MSENLDDRDIQSFPADAVYQLRISGRVGHSTLAWFEDMGVTFDETTSPVQTILSGPIRDQAALYGLINRVRDLGLILISVSLEETKEEDDVD